MKNTIEKKSKCKTKTKQSKNPSKLNNLAKAYSTLDVCLDV